MITEVEHLDIDARDVFSPRATETSVFEWLKSTFGSEQGLGFPSGRATIRFALQQAGVTEGDEVLVPGYSCYAARSAVEAVATPTYVDIDPETFLMDLEEAERKISASTAAILPTHLYGNACDMPQIAEFTADRDLAIVEDACQAIGTATRSDDIGRYSDYCTVSFSYYKDATAYAGGALLSDSELPSASSSLPNRSWRTKLGAIFAVDRTLSMLPGRIYEPLRSKILDPLARGGSESLGPTEPGVFADWADRLLVQQLQRLSARVDRRRANAAVYDETLPEPFQCPRRTANHSYFRYTVLVPERTRDELMSELRLRGIGCSPMYAYTIDRNDTCPVAADVASRILNLPVHAGLKPADVREIVALVTDTWEELHGTKNIESR